MFGHLCLTKGSHHLSLTVMFKPHMTCLLKKTPSGKSWPVPGNNKHQMNGCTGPLTPLSSLTPTQHTNTPQVSKASKNLSGKSKKDGKRGNAFTLCISQICLQYLNEDAIVSVDVSQQKLVWNTVSLDLQKDAMFPSWLTQEIKKKSFWYAALSSAQPMISSQQTYTEERHRMTLNQTHV